MTVGSQLREWRTRRRLTQLELALDSGVSARHLSFVETGRSQPGRDLLLRVTEELDVPFRERNQILLAAGHAPAFPERALDDPELAPVRETLELVLRGHEPYPAVALDRMWNLVAVNGPAVALTRAVAVDPALLQPPINALRLAFHPRGFASVMKDVGAWREFWLDRVERQHAVTGDERLAELAAEVAEYEIPGPEPQSDPGGGPLGPLRVTLDDGAEFACLAMFAGFDAPFDVTAAELAVELVFPADDRTARILEEVGSTETGVTYFS
ncbi:MAG TPA: helix-turn-helix transcriptional regulator [Thermoleophilaceae bacterium]|nr:helix-turn-helix transcriptional regulator [Thermoleophilaceae bacterium]